MKLTQTNKLVREILEKYPETRENDYLLWLKVLERNAEDSGIVIMQMSLRAFLNSANVMPISCFESVRRSRCKIQAECPELGASRRVKQARDDKMPEYIEFAKNPDSSTEKTQLW